MLSAPSRVANAEETDLARHIRISSVEQWGERRSTTLIGQHDAMVGAQEKILRFAQAEGPVLVTGETGTGKELFARAIYLLSSRRRKPFISVNCAQYADGQLIASELFGHRRGSFTGAVGDHRGVFEEADGGFVFLDEVGELTLTAQAMLLRVLGEGEVVPVGDSRARPVNVRVIAATNRDLGAMVAEGRFRADLLYRLRFLHLRIPPVRERGEDWRLMADHYIRRLNAGSSEVKRLSARSIERLARYTWPGNVRELRGLMECAFCLAQGPSIEPEVFEEHLQDGGDAEADLWGVPRAVPAPVPTPAHETAQAVCVGGDGGMGSFWSAVYEPFMDRELNRDQVKIIVAEGLRRSNWSYKRALQAFGVDPDDYLKFMDFLRHHRLKPER